MVLGTFGGKICLCDWVESRRRQQVDRRVQRVLGAVYEVGDDPLLPQAAAQLDSYFSGRLRAFSLPLCWCGTSFQQAVWQALLEIPFGCTVTYGELAHRLGCPSAVRAVAGAVGANAQPVLVPCHRVVGADGALTGFSGGLKAKAWLLAHEDTGKLDFER